MFYTYRDFISTSYARIAKKKDTLGKRDNSFQVEKHENLPTGEYRWLGEKPLELAKPQRIHSDECVIESFEANGGTQQGVKDNWLVTVGGVQYVVKKIDGRTTVAIHDRGEEFPISGIQAGSEI